MTVTLPRPDCVNILWTILSGLHLAEYVTKSICKFRRNVNKILFSHYRLENGGCIFRPQCANTLLLKQNSFYFADDILIYIFEFVLLLHMQLSYLKMNLKSWSAKHRPCLCLDVLIRCGSDKVTSILKTTFSISFLTSGEIWNGSHVSAAMLWGRDKMVPLSRWYIQINFPVWNCFIFFYFKFDLSAFLNHDDVIKWKHFPRYWPFVRGIHRSLVNPPHKGQWRGALIFSLICLWINGWVNNREAGDLRRYRAHLTSP